MNNALGSSSGLTLSGFRSLAWVGGVLASLAACVVAAVLALVFTASLVVIAVMAAALAAFALLAARARRALRGGANSADPQIIEAHNVGGHSWVAYGWDQRN
jgi:hypothetical protein